MKFNNTLRVIPCIHKDTDILKFIIFPEEFPIIENKEQKEMFFILEKDDIDGFLSFLSNNPKIDITKEQDLKVGGYYYSLFDYYDSIFLIDFCCFFVMIHNVIPLFYFFKN